MKRYLIPLIALFSMLPFVASANPAFAVAPDRMHINLKQAHTYVFIIKNTGDQLIHVRIFPSFLSAASKELAAGKLLVDKAQEAKYSLIPYTIISPQVLSLQPTQQRDVRVSIQPPNNLKPGTYREHISVKMLEIAHRYAEQKQEQGKSVGIDLNLLLQIAPVIYGDVGPNQAKLHITCQTDHNGNLVLHTRNPTAYHFSGDIEGTNPKAPGKPLFKLKENVFQHTQKDIETKWKPDVGSITLKWRNEFNAHEGLQSTQCHFK